MAIILQEYERLKFLGKGAFAQIYKVRHKDLGYVRAIKVLTEEVNEGEDDKLYKTFLKECSLLLRIGNGGHPNIIRIYQPRKIDGKALVEMDYVDGETLESYVSGKGFIPIEEVYRFIKEIGSALAYCHVDCYRYMMLPEEKGQDPGLLIKKYGVAHNDIHSNNIMRKNLDGSYVLLDFGLAIQDDKAVKSSSRGDGAAEYIPPEKWSGEEIPNEKAVDVYGFGILIYQMLTGRVPFVLDPDAFNKDSLKTLNQVRHQHETERPAPILPLRKAAYEKALGRTDYDRDYPDWLEELVYKCLEKNPEDRFHDARELQAFFLEHLEADSASKEAALVSLQKENNALNQRVDELEEGKDTLKTELESINSVCEGYKKTIESKDREIKKLKEIPSVNKNIGKVIFLSLLSCLLAAGLLWGGYRYYRDVKMAHPEELRSEIDSLNALLAQKEKDIIANEASIAGLNKRVATLSAQLQEASKSDTNAGNSSQTINSQQQTINSLRTQVQSLTQEVARLKRQGDGSQKNPTESSAEVATLRKRIGQLESENAALRNERNQLHDQVVRFIESGKKK